MGLDFLLAGASWPDRLAPDWWALRAAARDLPLEIARRVDAERMFSELGAETDEQMRAMAISEVLTGIHQLQIAIVQGSGDFSILTTSEGHTVLLDGGVSGGDDPTQTWYGTTALMLTGLLGEPMYGPHDQTLGAAIPRSSQQIADVAHSVSPRRLAVAELPPTPDWDVANAAASEEEGAYLERLQAVVGGAYSRTTAAIRVGGRLLFIADRAQRDGPAALIDGWEHSGLLTALGGQALHDVRVRVDRAAAAERDAAR